MSMPQLRRMPYWVSVPITVGGTFVTAFASQFPESFQLFGLIFGLSLCGVGLCGWVSNYVRYNSIQLPWLRFMRYKKPQQYFTKRLGSQVTYGPMPLFGRVSAALVPAIVHQKTC